MHKLLFIPGSLRKASSSRATVRALCERLDGQVETAVADPGTLPHYNSDVTDDPNVREFLRAVADADAVVFVLPEYNYSIPGLLKNAIDWASRPAYQSVFRSKPCTVVTVSGGATGGIRAQSHLKYVLNGMLADLYPAREIIVPMANSRVENGLLTDTAILDFAEETIVSMLADRA